MEGTEKQKNNLITAKTWELLNSEYKNKLHIDSKQDQIERLRDNASKSTASYTARMNSGTETHSKVETNVCKYIDLERQLAGFRQRAAKDHARLILIIAKVEDEEQRRILTLRHVQLLTWGNISRETKNKKTALYYKHQAAIRAFDEASKNNI